MKRVSIFEITLAMVVMLAGCGPRGTPAGEKLMHAYEIVAANVPYATNTSSTQFDDAELLEEDIYGRQLIGYKTWYPYIQQNIEIYLICQKTEGEYVYYYMDDCYIVRAEESEQFSEKDVLALKNSNDWDCPLDETKMSKVNIEGKQAHVMYADQSADELKAYLGLDETYGVLANGMEMLSENAQMFYGYSFLKNDERQEHCEKHYLFVCIDNEDNPVIACKEFEMTFDCQETVREFRENWEMYKTGDDSLP